MGPQMGRPKAENPKNVEVKVRFDENKNKAILNYCDKHKITRTEMIRQGIDLLLEQDK